MQSSCNIIKNKHVNYSKKVVTFSDIKFRGLKAQEEYTQEVEALVSENDELAELNDFKKKLEKIEARLRAEIEEERRAILKRTVKEAEEEIAKYRDEVANKAYEESREEGYEAGYTEGVKKALKDCEEKCNEIKQNALNLLEQAKMEVDAYVRENEQKIIALAADMAESIVHKTIDTSDENILTIIRPIIEQFEGKESIVITCQPENFDFLNENIKKLEEANSEARFILLADGNLEKNGCTIENDSKIIDLQIRKQLDSIIEDLKNMED
jgi:flagellar assembly protein FliH